MPEAITTPSVITPKERKFPCKSCGADLVFAPKQGELQCPQCGHTEKIPQTEQEIREYSFNDYLAKPRGKGYGREEGQGRDLRCGGCGAVAHLDASVRATTCPFCGAPMIADDKAVKDGGEDVITPEALVPFAITVEQARESFRKWISSLWFAPSALKQESQMKQMQGVYRPFWTYDTNTISHWTGERGDHYYVTESYTATENNQTVTKTRQVQKTRWTFVSGIYSNVFDDVLVSAGNKTDHDTTFELKKLIHFTPEYLSGFAAERYVVTCEQGWSKAKEIIAEEIRGAVRSSIGGNEQRVLTVSTAYSGVTYKHVLLPLWLSCYRYGDKNFQFQVNGQTGEVKGSRPYSVWKILWLIVSLLAVLGLILLLTQHKTG